MNEDSQNITSVEHPPPQRTQPPGARNSGKQRLILSLLLLLVLSVFFLLPRFVTKPWFASENVTAPVAAAPAPSEVSPSTAAEKTKYRQDAQKLLAEIIANRDRLKDENVESWAEIDFRNALENVRTGDQQYADGDYQASLSSYELGLNRLDALIRLGQEKLNKAVADGTDAIETLDVPAAASAAELANSIAPEDERVKQLVRRAAVLPKVSQLVASGNQSREARQYNAAKASYQAAVDLDPAHKSASAALHALEKDILEHDFRKYMSAGYAALDNNDFDGAKTSFLQANRIYPGHESVKQALALVENRQSQLGIDQQIDRASELEAREEWQQAVQMYQSILAQDPSLVEVKVRLIPAQVRSSLDERMTAIIDDPLSLSNKTAFRNAQQVLDDARGISNPGQKLRAQIAGVEQLLQRASKPVEVVFQSDNQTDVTVYRVARLGQFEKTTLQLKPGRYIAAGTRKGFRDVRVEFTITGVPLDSPIVVRCEEPI